MQKSDEIPFGACSPPQSKPKELQVETRDTKPSLSTTVTELDLIPDQMAPGIFEFQEESKTCESLLVDFEKQKTKLNFKYNPTYEHELVTDQSFRTAGLMGLIYSTQEYKYDSLNDLLKICIQLDKKFF